MTRLSPLPIEERVLRALLRSEAESVIEIHARRFTGVGLYTDFSVRPDVSPGDLGGRAAGPLRGPEITSPAIPGGAGTLLWVKESGIHTLEIFAYADAFPEDLKDFELSDTLT